jgi:hypothetical protein
MRRSLSVALSAACAVAGLALGAGTAQAAPHAAAPATLPPGVTSCQFSHNGSLWLAATCDASATTGWYLTIHCVRGTGTGAWVKGTLEYGNATSWAQCATGYLEIDGAQIVAL